MNGVQYFPSDIDEAVVAYLAADPDLAALCPDGVWFDAPPIGAKRYVIVSLFDYGVTRMFGGVAWETFTYLIKAMDLQKSGRGVDASARRIDALLTAEDWLTVPGRALMLCQQRDYIRKTETDAVQDVRWQHRGGFYEVWISAVPTAQPLA